MLQQPKHLPHPNPLKKQRGASLFVVFILLLLTVLLVLGAMRVSIFNESIVGNQADHQRAYAAAEALMQHAANEIYTQGPHCPATQTDCRYPANDEDFEAMAASLLNTCGTGLAGTNNPKGVCIPASPDARVFQTDYIKNKPAGETAAIQMSDETALSYTDFSGSAKSGSANLALDASKGQYWVEIFKYQANLAAQGTGHMPHSPDMPENKPDATYPFIYRITVRAQGLKPESVVILRSFYIPLPAKKT